MIMNKDFFLNPFCLVPVQRVLFSSNRGGPLSNQQRHTPSSQISPRNLWLQHSQNILPAQLWTNFSTFFSTVWTKWRGAEFSFGIYPTTLQRRKFVCKTATVYLYATKRLLYQYRHYLFSSICPRHTENRKMFAKCLCYKEEDKSYISSCFYSSSSVKLYRGLAPKLCPLALFV